MIAKICGVRSFDDAGIVNEAGPDMAGFVFYRPSRRSVDPGLASELRDAIDPSIRTVGVFVDEDPGVIADLVSDGTISVVQLHGAEDPMYILGLRAMTHAPIIKSFVVRSPQDVAEANASPADMVMLDAGKGSGSTFDWSLTEGMGRDFILSGGLTPDTVADAITRTHPYGVDVSSGVETDGRKDPVKVSAFMDAVRSARIRADS